MDYDFDKSDEFKGELRVLLLRYDVDRAYDVPVGLLSDIMMGSALSFKRYTGRLENAKAAMKLGEDVDE